MTDNETPLALALIQSDMTREQLAAALDVHVNTIYRYVKGERRPRADMRQRIAELVGQTEPVLWPELTIAATASDHGSEVVDMWRRQADIPVTVWESLISGAERAVDVTAGSGLLPLEMNPDIGRIFASRPDLVVRVCLRAPDPDDVHLQWNDETEGMGGTLAGRISQALTMWQQNLAGVNNAQIRTYSGPMLYSIFRFDDQMILNTHLYGVRGIHAPAWHLSRLDSEGVFDRYAENFDHLWQTSQPYEPLNQ